MYYYTIDPISPAAAIKPLPGSNGHETCGRLWAPRKAAAIYTRNALGGHHISGLCFARTALRFPISLYWHENEALSWQLVGDGNTCWRRKDPAGLKGAMKMVRLSVAALQLEGFAGFRSDNVLWSVWGRWDQ